MGAKQPLLEDGRTKRDRQTPEEDAAFDVFQIAGR